MVVVFPELLFYGDLKIDSNGKKGQHRHQYKESAGF